MPTQPIIVENRRPIVLDAEQIYLTPTARRKAQARAALKLIKFLLAPLLLAQALAFGSFIYEESLQSTAFGIRAAMEARDPALTAAAVQRFEHIMLSAQAWQKHWGRIAFWTHDSFYSYFEIAAPTQLLGFYVSGVHKGLWQEVPGRYVDIMDRNGNTRRVDRWAIDPDARFRDFHFDVQLLHRTQNIATPTLEEAKKFTQERRKKLQ